MSDTQTPTPSKVVFPEMLNSVQGTARLQMLPALLQAHSPDLAVKEENVRIQNTTNDSGSTSYAMITLSKEQYLALDESCFGNLKISIIVEDEANNSGYKKKQELSGDFIASLLANKR